MSPTSTSQGQPTTNHGLLSDSNYKYKFPARQFPGRRFVISFPEYSKDLETRLPDASFDQRHNLDMMYTSYRSQADKLQAEAEKLERCDARKISEQETTINQQASRGVDAGRPLARTLKDTIKTLHAMRAICLTRVRILETGSLKQIEQLKQMDDFDDQIMQATLKKDETMRLHLRTSWPYLKSEWERLFRLRLIHLLMTCERRSDQDLNDLTANLENTMASTDENGDEEIELELALEEARMHVEMILILEAMSLKSWMAQRSCLED